MIRLGALVLIAQVALGCGPKLVLDDSYNTSPPRTVAILPFSSPDQDAHTLEQVHFATSLPFIDLHIDNVDSALRAAGIRSAEDLEGRAPAELARLLGVDAVILGRVSTIKDIAPLLAYYRSLGAEIEMRTGSRRLFSIEHTQRSAGGPLIESQQLIYAIMDQLRNSTSLAFIDLCEKWCQQVVDKIGPPTTPIKINVSVPRVHTVSVLPSRSGPLQPGDRIVLEVSADPGLSVAVDLGLGTRLSLAEDSNGTYRGTYIVQLGDRVDLERVTAEARNRYDVAGRGTSAAGLKIVARPPGSPGPLKLR